MNKKNLKIKLFKFLRGEGKKNVECNRSPNHFVIEPLSAFCKYGNSFQLSFILKQHTMIEIMTANIAQTQDIIPKIKLALK